MIANAVLAVHRQVRLLIGRLKRRGVAVRPLEFVDDRLLERRRFVQNEFGDQRFRLIDANLLVFDQFLTQLGQFVGPLFQILFEEITVLSCAGQLIGQRRQFALTDFLLLLDELIEFLSKLVGRLVDLLHRLFFPPLDLFFQMSMILSRTAVVQRIVQLIVIGDDLFHLLFQSASMLVRVLQTEVPRTTATSEHSGGLTASCTTIFRA